MTVKFITDGFEPPVTEAVPDVPKVFCYNMYEGWNFNSGNYLFTTDTK